VSIALLVAAAACAYVASKSSGDELDGAYRDSARSALGGAASRFEGTLRPADLDEPSALRGRVRELVMTHPEVTSAAIYAPGAAAPVATFGAGTGSRAEARLAVDAMSTGEQGAGELREGDRRFELLATPIAVNGRPRAALVTGQDLQAADEALAERNRRVLVVLGVLLALFALFAGLLLQLGIFRPLTRLRLATQAVGSGDLRTRLGWRRRDELGRLAADFDAMATDLEENHRRLEELAHRDPLTGLANHRRFQEALGDELEAARREGRPLAVVLIDIDDFKLLNDSRGHPVGDETLGAAAGSLRAAMLGLGQVARVGGDEFGIVLPGVGPTQALALAEAARAAVEGAGTVRSPLRCSAGTACFPDDARTSGALLQLASGALAWAKAGGGGRSRRYDPEHVFVVTDEQREEFAELIARPHAVTAVFQPIVALATGEPVGYEALARFEGKPGLPPSWWFSQAHRFGLGAALEAEAVGLALATPGRPEGSFISVNLSPSALGTPEVHERLPANLQGVVVEITEEERVRDVEGLQRHLDPLRARGARIAVDDAGEGYAGLQQVMSMRADIIKLDRALVADVHADPAKIALIGSLVHFARSTGASICAEGIETLSELRVLIHLGVATGQGWVLARPGAPWPEVDPEAARLCRELRAEQSKIVPIGSKRSA